MALHKVTILTKPGCHLCENARQTVLQVVSAHTDILVEELNILEQPDLHAKYHDDIPVILIDGQERFRHRVDPDALAQLFYNEFGMKLLGF